MKLVVYDSLYGNTGKVAQAIADGVGAEAKPMGKVNPSEAKGLDLLIVGSPLMAVGPPQECRNF